jgi:iron(III) transport system permease protein
MTIPYPRSEAPTRLIDQRIFKQRVRQRLGIEDVLRRALMVLIALWLLLFLIYPLLRTFGRSLQDQRGNFVGLANYHAYLSSPTLSASLRHSLYVATLSALITVGLAFIYAYALTRTTIRGKGILQSIAMLPIFVPSLVQALAFIYMFGNNGIVTRLLGVNIGLYGPVGIILSEVFYAFPHALIILIAALLTTDARLYEAAESLGASSLRTFLTITVPIVKYGVLSALFVSFTLAITDFGAPKVVGGNYDVLATDIYNKVIGQQDFSMGATISTLLLIPALVAFVLDRIVQRRQVSAVTANITPMGARKHSFLVQGFLFVLCLLMAGFILSVYVIVALGAFTHYWPYDLSFTVRHFTSFYVAGAHHRWGPFVLIWNSIKMAFITATLGTVITFGSAYLIEKTRGLNLARAVLYLLSIVPLAVPGMVLGLSYLFVFNDPKFPLNTLYGTMAIMAVSTIIHYYTVPFLTAMTALKQMDPEFEAIGESLDAPFYRTFFRITVPIALPSIISIAMYFFLNAMVTLSAVVFLFVPGKELASLAVMLLDDAGESAQAMALSLMIFLTSLLVRGIFQLLIRGVTLRTQAWTRR